VREYPLSLKASLKVGIRRDHRLGRNAPGLLECVNLKPIDESLVYAEAPTQPLLTPPTEEWPYPQLIRGKGKTILAGKETLQYVNEATWGLTDIPVYNLAGGLNDLIVNGAFSTDPDTGPTWRYGDQWAWSASKMVRTPGSGDPVGDGDELIDDDPNFDEEGVNPNVPDPEYWTSSDVDRLHADSSPAAKTCAKLDDVGYALVHDSLIPEVGQKYVVQFELYAYADLDGTDWSSKYNGSTEAIRVTLGGANSVYFNSDGVKILAITASTTGSFGFNGAADVGYNRRLFLDNISVQKWDHDSTVGADNLYQLFTDMVSAPVEGRRYKVTYTVTRSAGSVTAVLGGTSGTARSAAGTYTDYIVCGSGDRLNFLASETFNGSVDLVQVMEDVQSGGVNGWHFMDFWDVWALFNTESTVFVLKRSALGGSDVAQIQSEVTIKTGCAHRGRAIMGGFDATNFWKSEWVTFWNSWITSMGLSLPTISETGPGGNFVMWSTIGGGDAFSVLFPATAQEGLLGSPSTDGSLGDSIPGAAGSQTAITDPYATGEEVHSASKPLIFDLFERGEWGLMPMPWQGAVLHVRPLAEGVMVYGEDGIAALFLASADGVSTYGLKELGIRTGIKSRDAVGGDEKTHAYVDAKGALWLVDGNLEPMRLGYQNIFNDLSNLIVSHDPLENEFYISDGSTCFILTKDGLGSVNMPVSSLAHIDGTLYAPNMEPHEDTTLCSFMSDTIDMGVSGMKTVRVVKVAADFLYNMRVIIHYCSDPGEGEFEEAEPIPFNEAGVAFPGITAHFFRVEVVGERKPGEYPTISDVDLGWCLVDKRYTRGVYAN